MDSPQPLVNTVLRTPKLEPDRIMWLDLLDPRAMSNFWWMSVHGDLSMFLLQQGDLFSGLHLQVVSRWTWRTYLEDTVLYSKQKGAL